MEPGLRGEQPLPDGGNMVLYLAFLLARCWRTGHGLNEMVVHHGQDAGIELAPLANTNSTDHGFRVVDNNLAGNPLVKGQSPHVGIEYHLQRFPRISDNKWLAAVAQLEVGHLDLMGHAADFNHLVAPVELVGFLRVEAERNEGFSDLAAGFSVGAHKADAIVGAGVPFSLQILHLAVMLTIMNQHGN